MALRAVARLQSADLVIHDDAVAPGILELARRDAERAVLDPGPGAAETIARTIAETAAAGDRVVLLAAKPWPIDAITGALATRDIAAERLGPPAA